MLSNIRDKIDWYAILFYIQYFFKYFWCYYIYSLIGTGGLENNNDYLWSVDEMRHIMANTTLSLCHGWLQEVREVERLEVTLMEDEIVYCRSVGDSGLSTSVPGSSTSVPNSSMS